ncbi:autotransporter-associated beta strand repeat-containing protein [Luteolibacter arcticus]|uniref:Autotransporter-associated beta strand repeat-containing protein n=1 Tax=Luteolibacter arcticus TaxID=1581411 RepID=A0ABT3GLV7_9BACT|nr:autotransporter-associated beta strand repeat-containing protein [Luteolibacter arcticus]MCW1924456.1 autotransporter-associated beta strand repeat-containing protein [Luteolibacter arcticus]
MKSRNVAIAGLILASPPLTLHAAALTWSAGVNSNWDTSTANWTGSTWSNAAPDQATFAATGIGTVTLTTAITANKLTFDNAGYTVAGNTLTLAGATPTIQANVDATISSVLAGSAGLVKSGSGQVTLSGANTFTGGTTLSAGTIKVAANNALASGSITLNDANTGSSNTTLTTSANTGAVPAPNNIIVANQGTGTTTLELTAQNAQFGGAGHQLNRAVTVQANFNGGGGAYFGKYDFSTVVSGNVGTLTLRAVGTGQLYFGGNNTFTGTVALTQGTVAVGGANAFGGSANSVVMSGSANLRSGAFGNPLVIGDLTGAATNTIDKGSQLLTISSANSAEFAGVISGSGGLTKSGSGTQNLSGANTYTGTTTVNGGTLRVNGSLAAGSAVAVASGGTLDGTGTINGSISTVSGATLSPGNSGIGTLTGGAILTLAGNANFEINKAGAVLTNDKVEGLTTVNYGGMLTVTASGDALGIGDTFPLFVAGAYNSAFTGFSLPALSSGLSWDTSNLLVDGTIKVVNFVSPPTFNPPGGGYVGAQSVTITSDSGSTIRYTNDGTDPTTSGTVLTGASPLSGISVPNNSTITLKAYATKAGQANSPVVTTVYQTVTTPTWNVDADGNWSEAVKWLNNVIPDGSGVPVDFSAFPQSADATVILDGNRTVGGITFGNTQPISWTLNASDGGVLTLAGGTPTVMVANNTATISAPLAGTQGMVKSGSGELTLSGTNTYGGGTVLSTGILRTTSDSALSAGSITLNDASTGTSDTTLSTTANKTGTPVQNDIIVSNQGTGTTTLELAIQNSSFSGSSLQLNKPTTVQANYNGIGGAYFGKYDFTSVVSGNVGTLTLRALGTGQLYFGGNNTFTGTVALTQGTIATAHVNAFGGIANSVVMSGTANLRSGGLGNPLVMGDLTGAATNTISTEGKLLTISSANSADFAGVISGTGGLTKAGTGAQTLSGANTYTGNTTVSDGTLVLASTGTLAFKIGANGVTNQLSGSGAATLDGSFALDLTGANTTDGNSWTLVNVGTLTETFSASFAVNGFTQASDVWTMNSAGKKWTFTESTGILTVGPASGYTSWADSFAGLSDTTAGGDPDHDGISNLIEYIIGGDPRVSSTSFLPTHATVGSNLVLSYKRSDDSETDTTQTGQWSANLIDWTDIAPVLVNENADAPDDMTISIPVSNAVNGKLFGRFHATKP